MTRRDATHATGASGHRSRRERSRAVQASGRGKQFLPHAIRHLAEVLSIGLAGALASIACCGFFLVSWLAQVVFTIGGVAAVLALYRYEAVLSLLVAVAAVVSWRLSTDRLSRLSNAALGGFALYTGSARLIWEQHADLILAVPLLYWPFTYRQAILAVLAMLVLGVRIVTFVHVLRTAASLQVAKVSFHGMPRAREMIEAEQNRR